MFEQEGCERKPPIKGYTSIGKACGKPIIWRQEQPRPSATLMFPKVAKRNLCEDCKKECEQTPGGRESTFVKLTQD